MEIHLTPEKEALLRQVAARTGQDAAQVVQEAVDRLLDHDTWFVREVEKGQLQAAKGDLIEHDEVVARIERRLKEASLLVRIVWTTSAVLDLEQISDYLLEKHPEFATTTIQSIFKSVSELKLFPARGRPGRKKGTRELVLTQLPYLAVYELVGEMIRILRVLHGARRWPE